MAQINPNLPVIGNPLSTEDQKIIDAFTAILGVLNGGIDSSNISATAGIADTQLASGGSTGLSTFRTVFASGSATRSGSMSSSTLYVIGGTVLAAAATESSNPFFYDPANFAVTGKTQKVRIRGQLGILGTTGTFTIGLYPVSALNSGSGFANGFTYGAAFTSFTVVNPTINTVTTFDSGDVTAPSSAGLYAIGVTPSATISGNGLSLSAALLSKNV